MTSTDLLALFAHVVIAGLIAPMWLEIRRLNAKLASQSKRLGQVEQRLKDCLDQK